MRRKGLSCIGIILTLLVLAGCESQNTMTEGTVGEASSTYTAQSTSVASEASEGTSSSLASESSASEADTASSERSADQSGNGMRAIHLEDILPLIHQATDNLYKSEAYSFVPSNVDDHTVQVEVRRDNSNDPSHSNLIALFRYDTKTKQLFQQDMMNGQWQEIPAH
ncbi:MAG: hypothetical protein Q4A67_04050 [Aerococcus sp.]|nr:hypothetical protein [Aerococcus sp.]